MDFQTFLVYSFLMSFCVGSGYLRTLCPINEINQEGRVERNKLYQAIVFSNIVVLSFFCHYLLVKNKTSVLEKLHGMGIIMVYFLHHYRHIIQSDSINPYNFLLL